MFLKSLLGVSACVAALATGANAASISYSIENLATGSSGTSSTYAGQGFVGMYASSFNDIFGAEFSFSTTLMQVDISALSGVSINSASLDFTFTNGSSGLGGVDITRVSANGTLGFQFTPADNLGVVNASVMGRSANSVDVTGLLSGAVSSGDSWLGLHLANNGTGAAYLWSAANRVGNADAAQVRLVVDYDTASFSQRAVPVAPVPLPAGFPLLGAGLLIFGAHSRRRK